MKRAGNQLVNAIGRKHLARKAAQLANGRRLSEIDKWKKLAVSIELHTTYALLGTLLLEYQIQT
jgi:hypothetical protein